MIQIPPKVRIPLCIESGSVFNFYIEFDSTRRESKNRYFVVLNDNPRNDVILVMLTPTTKIEKTKTLVRNWKISLKTVVEVNQGDHCIFTKDCVFNCNDAFGVSMDNLVKKIEENGSMNYPIMPEDIIKRLIVGIKESPRVSPEIKKLL